MKLCNKCKAHFLETFFSKSRSMCKGCIKEINAIHTKENKEKMLEKGRIWRQKNPNYSKEYHKKNKEEANKKRSEARKISKMLKLVQNKVEDDKENK